MKKLMMGLAMAVFVAVSSAPAEAGFITINISSSTCSVACAPVTLVGGTNFFASGPITFGDVSLTINGASNNPGTSTLGFLTQQDIAVQTASDDAEIITIEITQTDFTDPTGLAFLGSAVSGTGAVASGTSTATLTSGYGATNLLSQYTFSPTVLSCNFGGVVPPPACSDNSSMLITSVSPYSLSNNFVISLAAGAGFVNVTGTTTVVAVPDGGVTMSLLGMAMAGLGLMARRRK